jgi:hypothetical protein
MLDGGGEPIPCVVWDISEGGARIAAARAIGFPDRFALLTGKDAKSCRFCHVVWRREGQLGVRFIEEAVANINVDPSPRRQRPRPVATPPAAAKAGAVVAASQLMLPGCGPHRASDTRSAINTERRPLAFSSIAFLMLVLLCAATGLFAFANLENEARWTLEVCNSARNFCQHPEWTGAAGAVMLVVYLAVKGMER